MFAPSCIHKVASKNNSPVASMNSQTPTVTPTAGKNPAPAVTSGIPNIPAPIVVPATSSVPLTVRIRGSLLSECPFSATKLPAFLGAGRFHLGSWLPSADFLGPAAGAYAPLKRPCLQTGVAPLGFHGAARGP